MGRQWPCAGRVAGTDGAVACARRDERKGFRLNRFELPTHQNNAGPSAIIQEERLWVQQAWTGPTNLEWGPQTLEGSRSSGIGRANVECVPQIQNRSHNSGMGLKINTVPSCVLGASRARWGLGAVGLFGHAHEASGPPPLAGGGGGACRSIQQRDRHSTLPHKSALVLFHFRCAGGAARRPAARSGTRAVSRLWPRVTRSHVRCGGEHPPNCTVWGLPDCKACQRWRGSARDGGSRRGRQQGGKCSSVAHKMPPLPHPNSLKPQPSACVREYQLAQFLSLFWTMPHAPPQTMTSTSRTSTKGMDGTGHQLYCMVPNQPLWHPT